MPSLSLPGQLIWFAHCPKAGGTSVERFMVDHFGPAVGHLHWGWDLWWKGGGWRQAEPPCSPQHLIWEDALGALPAKPDLVFALVRDPLSRLISEYRYQRRARRGTRAGRWLTYLPFSTWVRLMLRVAEKNPYAFDNHLRPQWEFVPDGAKVFRLEEGIAPVLAWLSELTGAAETEAPPHILAAGAGPQIRLYSEDIALISKAFSGDYERFGYSPPCRGDVGSDSRVRLRAAFVEALLPLALWLERCGKL